MKIISITLAVIFSGLLFIWFVIDFDSHVHIANNTGLEINEVSLNVTYGTNTKNERVESKIIFDYISKNQVVKYPINMGDCTFSISIKLNGSKHEFDCGYTSGISSHVLVIGEDLSKAKCRVKIHK